MEAILDFLLMPLLGLVSAALCIGILFCLNHIANGGLRGNGGYAFEGLVNVPSSTLDTDAPRAELIRRRNMHKAKLQQQEDTGLFTPPFVPPAPYHPRRLSMMHIIKTPPSPSATFLPAISPSSPASSALAQLQRWPLVAMRRAEARDSMEFVTTTSPNIPVLMQGGGRNVHSQAPGRVPSPSLNPVRVTARTFGQEPSLQAPHTNGAIPQPLPASEVPSPGVVADDNNPPAAAAAAAAALDQHQAGPPPAPPPPAPEARVEVSTENASLAELIAVMARSKKLVIDPVGTNGETRTPSRILLKRVSDQSPMARTPTTDPSSAKRRRAEGAEGAESEMEESQPRKRVHTPMPKDKAVPSSAQRKRKPEFISSATRSRTPSSSKKPGSQKSEPEAKKSRGAQQKSSPPTAVREDGETPRRKKNILERVLAVYPPSLPPPVADTPGRYEESTVVMDAQQTPAMASTPMMPPLSMGPPPPVVAMTMSSPVSPSLLLEQLSPRGGASADRPLSPRGRAPLASSSQERKDMLNGRKRRTVSFDEQQLLQVVQQEDERKRKLMRELEQEELADKKANKRVGKLLQAATPKKRVQINMEASVIKFDSFAPPSDSAAAKGKPEEQQKPGDLPGSVTFDSSSTSLFASTNWEWDSPASSSEKKEPKPTKRREKRGRAGSDSSSPGSSALVSSADLPSDMPLPILFSSDTSSSSSSRSTAASAGGSSVASFFSGDAASPFDSFLSSASSASSSASANDPFFSPTPVAAARDSSATTTSSDALASLFGPGAISNTSAAVAAAASPSRRRRSTSASESDAYYSFLSPASAASPSSAPSVSFNPGSLFGPSSTTPTGDSAKPADAGLGSIFGPPSSSTSSSSSSTSSASARGGSKPPLFREASSVSIFNDVPGKRTPLTKPSAARDPSLESQRGQLMASSGSAFVNRSASPSPSRPSPSSSSSSSSSFNPGSLFGPPSTSSSSSSSSASAPGDIFSFSVTPSSGSSTIFDPTASSTSFEFPTEYRSGGGGGGAEDQTPGDEDEEDQYDDDQEEEQGEGEEEYDDEEEFPQPEEEESHNIVWYPPESTVPLEERVKSRPLNRQAGSQPQQYSTGDDGGGRGGRQQQRGGRGGGQGRGQGQGSWRGGGRGQPRGGASSRGGAPASGGGGQARGGGGSSGGGGRERRPRTDARTERGGGARGGSRGRGGGRGGRGGGRGQGEGGGRGRATASEACPW